MPHARSPRWLQLSKVVRLTFASVKGKEHGSRCQQSLPAAQCRCSMCKCTDCGLTCSLLMCEFRLPGHSSEHYSGTLEVLLWLAATLRSLSFECAPPQVAVLDTVCEAHSGAAQADRGKLLKHFRPDFPAKSDPSLATASSLFAAFVFQKSATPRAPPCAMPAGLPFPRMHEASAQAAARWRWMNHWHVPGAGIEPQCP